MHPLDAIKSMQEAVNELRHCNEHAELVQQAREADRYAQAVNVRRRELERLGLASWHDGWELRSQAHAALMRTLPLLQAKAREAWAEANAYYARHVAPKTGSAAESASVEKERRNANTKGRMYRSGD